MSSSPNSIEPKTETPVPQNPNSPTDPTPPKTPNSETLDQEPAETKTQQNSDETIDEEEEGECGFCLFMKAGGCKDTFVDWEKCVEEAEKNDDDIVETCFQVTSALKKCMEAHSDYYAPLLDAEKAAEAEAVKHLEEEKEKERREADGGDSKRKEGDS